MFVLALILACTASAARRRAVRVTPPSTWNAQLTVNATGQVTVGPKTIASSSRLLATWIAPAFTIDHYVLTANEVAGGPPLTFVVTSTSTELTNLESGTQYRIELRACIDAACASSIASETSVLQTTTDEYWQIRGTGSSFSTAERIVSDGNTKPFAIRTQTGVTQLYYDPSVSNEKGVKLATSNDPLTAFTPLSGFGFLRGDGAGKMGTGPATFQIVPLSPRLGSKIRIVWEAAGSDQLGRIYSRDSVDGPVGRDFHSGMPTICQENDLAAGAPCAATLLIGVEGDTARANAHLRQARQNKIGLPLLDEETWDETPGTFMVLTAHLTDTTCSATFFNAGFAVWDGAQWNVQYAANGCPKLIPAVQAPMPLHLGGSRYKLYFNQNSGNASLKPLKLLYANGAASGDPDLVEFEDWETADRVRTIHVLWPNGVELTEAENSQFDDYQVWMPTRDRSLQVMYSNMNCPGGACGPPFIGMAILVNP
jgi:hypothetical protein